MSVDTRFLAYCVWGIGTVLVYGMVLVRRRRLWKSRHDLRARRDLVAASSLFLTALFSSAAIFAVLFGQNGTGIRGFMAALALGAFFAAGLVMATGEELT